MGGIAPGQFPSSGASARVSPQATANGPSMSSTRRSGISKDCQEVWHGLPEPGSHRFHGPAPSPAPSQVSSCTATLSAAVTVQIESRGASHPGQTLASYPHVPDCDHPTPHRSFSHPGLRSTAAQLCIVAYVRQAIQLVVENETGQVSGQDQMNTKFVVIGRLEIKRPPYLVTVVRSTPSHSFSTRQKHFAA